MRGLIKRTPECALHVHVAMPSPDAAVDALMGLREALPLIGAIGRGLAVLVRLRLGPGERALGCDPGLPRARRPAAAARLGRVPRDARRDRLGGGPEDHTMVWWDARLQPRLGTVELRELDVQAGLEQTAAMAALVHAPRAPGGRARRTRWRPPRRCTGRASAPCATGSTPSCCPGRLRPAREAAREPLDELRGSDDALGGRGADPAARAGRRRASARCSRRPAWRVCCARWPTKPAGRGSF